MRWPTTESDDPQTGRKAAECCLKGGMDEGREVGRRPRKRTERVLSLTSDSDEHFLAARALRPCLPCWPTDTDTSESASSFLSAAFYSNKEELSAKVERERESVLARLSYRVID